MGHCSEQYFWRMWKHFFFLTSYRLLWESAKSYGSPLENIHTCIFYQIFDNFRGRWTVLKPSPCASMKKWVNLEDKRNRERGSDAKVTEILSQGNRSSWLWALFFQTLSCWVFDFLQPRSSKNGNLIQSRDLAPLSWELWHLRGTLRDDRYPHHAMGPRVGKREHSLGFKSKGVTRISAASGFCPLLAVWP